MVERLLAAGAGLEGKTSRGVGAQHGPSRRRFERTNMNQTHTELFTDHDCAMTQQIVIIV